MIVTAEEGKKMGKVGINIKDLRIGRSDACRLMLETTALLHGLHSAGLFLREDLQNYLYEDL